MDNIRFKSSPNAATLDRTVMEKYRQRKIEAWEATMRMRMNNGWKSFTAEDFVKVANSLGYKRD